MKYKFRIGDKVIGLGGGGYTITEEGWKGYVVRVINENTIAVSEKIVRGVYGMIVKKKYFKVIDRTMKKGIQKAEYRIGDKIKNNNEGQLSEILNVVYDKEYDEFSYVVRCLEDGGSIHTVLESETSVPAVEKLTIDALVKYYQKNKSCIVEVVKK